MRLGAPAPAELHDAIGRAEERVVVAPTDAVQHPVTDSVSRGRLVTMSRTVNLVGPGRAVGS